MLDTILWSLAGLALGPLAIVTITPLVWNTEKWYVRTWDFPRLQLASLTVLPAIPLIVLIARGSHPVIAVVLVAMLVVFAASGLVQMLPFTRWWTVEIDDLAATATDDSTLSILVANICYESDQHEAVAATIADAQPDLLLLIELDQTWRAALDDLAARFPHRIESIAGEGLGLALWSRRPLRDGRVEHILSERRPSIFADIDMPDGQSFRFVGLHPTPPGLQDSTGQDRRDSRVRDAELVLLARDIAEGEERNWIVAGDFNDVAWSHTTRLFKRLSGLLDPRVGRRLLNSFHAKYWFLRFPVDHLFVSPGFLVGGLERRRLPGSDHFGILGHLALEPLAEAKPPVSEANGEDIEEAHQAVKEGVEDARDRSAATKRVGTKAKQ